MIVMVEMIINNRNDNDNNSIYNICNGNIHSNKSSWNNELSCFVNQCTVIAGNLVLKTELKT